MQCVKTIEDFIEEFSKEDNEKVLLQNLNENTKKKITWRCPKCGTKWKASPYRRVRDGVKCPVCSGIIRK